MKTKEEILQNNLGKGLPNVRSVYYQRTIQAMQDYADQETQSLREQLKRKEDEIDKLRVVGREWVDKIESQSELIESLAGALKDAIYGEMSSEKFNRIQPIIKEYDNFKKKENGN